MSNEAERLMMLGLKSQQPEETQQLADEMIQSLNDQFDSMMAQSQEAAVIAVSLAVLDWGDKLEGME